MKLWEKGISTAEEIELFTVGNDRYYDRYLAPFDLKASLAHAQMLHKCGFLTAQELEDLTAGIELLKKEVSQTGFEIDEQFEDIHSYIEASLTRNYGEVGKKIHTARSRNDQVLVALQLYAKDALDKRIQQVHHFGQTLITLADKYKDCLMPGYTHLQVAMPSSFGLWLSAYAESLADDLVALKAAAVICDQNPLGSAAGYGSNFPIDRENTTEALGFKTTKVNSIAAQMLRGKMERVVVTAVAQTAATLARLAGDICLYMGQDFGFLSFNDQITTGSSIMPHKKNPDVFELIRARGNTLSGVAVQIGMLLTNLPTGYHRDLQLTKPLLMDSLMELEELVAIFHSVIVEMKPAQELLSQEKYQYIWSVDTLNAWVSAGMPFREAYRKMADEIAKGAYTPTTDAQHTHLGSIGNLGLDKISTKLSEAAQHGRYLGHSKQ